MTKSYRLIIVLTASAVLSGLLLSFLNIHTEPLIAAYQTTVLNNALSGVLPGSEKIEEKLIQDQQFYFGYDKTGKVSGVAFLAEGNGFQSKLRILVGMNAELNVITKIIVLEQKETPGLGTKIETDPGSKTNPEWFPNQFVDLNIPGLIKLVKNQKANKNAGEIMAITGATISSRAVTDIINTVISRNREILKENTELALTACPAVDAVEAENFDPELIPEGSEITKIGDKTFFLNKDNSGTLTGVAFLAKGAGFQSTIKLMVCMEPDFSAIKSVQVLDQNETADWGTRIINDSENSTDPCWFIKQFQGLSMKKEIEIVGNSPDKEAGKVQTISGATISSEAVIKILNESIKQNRDTYLKQKAN